MNADLIYEDITDANKLKSCMTNFLDVYNNTPGIVAMDLVLFRDAIEHGIVELFLFSYYTVITAININ